MDDLRRGDRSRRLQEPAGSDAQQSHPVSDIRLDLEAALGTLSPVERAAITLCDIEGWTHEEAAISLDMPLGTLKSIAARGRRKLREQLAGRGDGQ